MHRFAALLASLLALAAPARADDVLGQYFALLSPRDMYNSNGLRLTDFCSVVQQDRANFHRFGLRDELDQPDPFFGSREARARIPGLCRVMPGYDYIPTAIRRGETRYIMVQVMGRGGAISGLWIYEGAG